MLATFTAYAFLPFLTLAVISLLDDALASILRARFGTLDLDCAATMDDCETTTWEAYEASLRAIGLDPDADYRDSLNSTIAPVAVVDAPTYLVSVAPASLAVDPYAATGWYSVPSLALNEGACEVLSAVAVPVAPIVSMRGRPVSSVRPVGCRAEVVRAVTARSAVEAIVARVERAADRERAALVRAVETMTLRAMGA